MKHLKPYQIFESDRLTELGKWSWPKDLTIPEDIQMDIHDMSYDLRDEGYIIGYQWWPPYEQSNRLYTSNKYPHINITKRSDENELEEIYYMNIKDFCDRVSSYLDDKDYNTVVKFRKKNTSEYYNINDSIVNWGPFKDYPMCMSIHYRIEMINREIYGDVF